LASREEIILRIKGDSSSAVAALKATGHEVSNLTGKMGKMQRVEAGEDSGGAGFGTGLIAGASKAKVGLAAVALAIGLVGRESLQGASDWEKYGTILSNVLAGGQEQAQSMLAWLGDFAKQTPYELEEVVKAAVKLSAYGIDATKQLQILGDTASSMGKPLNEAVEALADAQTGEFERLKEFGLKAVDISNLTEDQLNKIPEALRATSDTAVLYTDKMGKEQVAAMNRNNREMVTATVTGIWNDRYAGGMEKLSKTWTGIWSNVVDSVKGSLRDIGGAILPYLEQWTSFGLEKFNQLQAFIKQFITIWRDGSFVEAMKQSFGTTGQVIGEALTGLVDVLRTTGGWLLEKGTAIWEAIKGPLGDTLQFMIDFVGTWQGVGFMDAIETSFGPGVRDRIQSVVDAFGSAKDVIGGAIEGIAAAFRNPTVQAIFGDIWDRVKDGVNQMREAFDKMAPARESLMNALSKLKPVLEWVAKIVGGVLLGVLWLVSAAFQGVAYAINFAAPLINKIAANVEWLAGVLGKWVSFMTGTVLPVIISVFQWIWNKTEWFRNLMAAAIHVVIAVFQLLWNKSTEIFWGIYNAISGAIGSAYDWVSDKATAIYDFLVNKFTAAKDKTVEIWNQIRDAIWGPIETVWNKLKDFGSFLNGLFGIGGGSTPADQTGASVPSGNSFGGSGFSMTQLPGMAGSYIQDIKHQVANWIRENVPAIGGWIADYFDDREPAWISGVKRMVDWLNAQVGKPYIWGGGHPPDPNLPGYDCSGLVSSALQVGGFPASGTTFDLIEQVRSMSSMAAKMMPIALGFYGDLSHVGIGVMGKWWEATPPNVIGPGSASSSWDLYGVPALAEGGVIRGPGMYIGGDNFSGVEVVMPLERAGELGFGKQQPVNVHLHFDKGMEWLKQFVRVEIDDVAQSAVTGANSRVRS